ncbi:MAG: hypothetical protein LC650_00815 [Actinobacteria bacterium]|nr:hypothetical protein [Actinomycetota bacterium]
MIIGLSGFARSGKDEAAAALVAEGFTRAAFADVLREMAYAADPYIQYAAGDDIEPGRYRRLQSVVDTFGWEAAKERFPDVRRLLQRLGTEAGRDILGKNIWVNTVLRRVADIEDVVITDVRFSNEGAAIKEHGGVVVNITRPGIGPVNGHISDNALEDYPFDEYIRNDGTVEDLHAMILEVVKDARD